VIRKSPAHADGAWVTLLTPDFVAPLQAAVRALDPHLDVELNATGNGQRIDVVRRAEPAKEASEVAVAKLSTGTDFAFETRRSLPVVAVT
jgi:hypothetical protein